MRISIYRLVLLVAASLCVASNAPAQRAFSAHTLTLNEGASSPPATIGDVAWIAGFWQGEALGGQAEEVWTPPSGGTMTSTYKLVQDGGVAFYEFQTITEEAGSLVLRLKHFNPDMTGWEERGDYVEFPLVKLEPDAAYFDGLTYLRKGADRLQIYAVFQDAEGEDTEGSFALRRVWPSTELGCP